MLFLLTTNLCYCQLLEEVPTSYQGRIRPLDTMARIWLESFYHQQTIKSDQINDFHLPNDSALTLLWKIQFSGYQKWEEAPLFKIHHSRIKEILGLPLKQSFFSYYDLNTAIYKNKKTNLSLLHEILPYHYIKTYFEEANRSGKEKLELKSLSPDLWVSYDGQKLVIESTPSGSLWKYVSDDFSPSLTDFSIDVVKQKRPIQDELLKLLFLMHQFTELKGPYAVHEEFYENFYHEMMSLGVSSQEVADRLEKQYPLHQRLHHAGSIFKVLPTKNGEWVSLNALTLKVFNTKTKVLEPIPNFTPYPNDQYNKIQSLYFQLIHDYEEAENKNQLAHLLMNNYQLLAGQPIQKAWGKSNLLSLYSHA